MAAVVSVGFWSGTSAGFVAVNVPFAPPEFDHVPLAASHPSFSMVPVYVIEATRHGSGGFGSEAVHVILVVPGVCEDPKVWVMVPETVQVAGGHVPFADTNRYPETFQVPA